MERERADEDGIQCRHASGSRSNMAHLSSSYCFPFSARNNGFDRRRQLAAKHRRVESFSIRTARARIHRTAIQALDRIDEAVDGLLSEEYSRNSIDNSFQRTAPTARDDGTSRRLRFDGCNTEILEAREDEGPAPRVEIGYLG